MILATRVTVPANFCRVKHNDYDVTICDVIVYDATVYDATVCDVVNRPRMLPGAEIASLSEMLPVK